MYSSKTTNKYSATFTGAKVGFLAEKEPYKEHTVKNTRAKGKQFLTVPAKNTCDGGGYFHKMTYTKGEEYNDKLMYTKTQPLESRKLGFGSHNAKNRDEFTQHIRTEQYREQLKAEKKVVATVPDDDDGPIDASAFWETSASVVGAGAKRTELTKPQHGRVAVTKEFYDRGHLHT
mmetsp:Transcript_82487/g.145569  ORF Transcript_82487/g.145569 Transcript_82487/m.145569 type:complete len:175 (+) Transcript_82487:60-584(+)|eukprot:CAMPEP_0197686378 /NCGR_PEP_ID=MMETSP1338-20131121/102405_1 /TAXON_ID=43686 ORGANISM="Pelagodinium beii, Strain RCC1491" /NCGR_SAMPLE_ID=MMETSP1338 /ASSEMBLY_ACC=CAM_ASM_000754 /LENGTH=174 /DNA_ID=CAMNT_0043268303 /DNA_START=39 /DNA_END=563 /DNA_ORIENTATION=+